MKLMLLLACAITLCVGRVNSQSNDSAQVVISHIFFCVDSITYQNLFKDEFLANKFAYSRESSSKTLTDSWTGKYLNGKQSYIEVFQANDKDTGAQLGDKFGDAAIVFRTKKPGDVQRIDRRIKADNRRTHFELMKYESNGKVIPFNYNLYLANAELQQTFRPYVEELTANFLELCGFSESEIAAGVTAEQFWEKRRGKKYEKLYDNIEKIELVLKPKEFEYLAQTLQYVGFAQTGRQFKGSGLEILCSVQQDQPYKLKAIYFTLLNEINDITVGISKNLTFTAGGKTASFHFNY